MFLVVFLMLGGFLLNLGPLQTLDGPREDPLAIALAVDDTLIAVFAVPHSAMARPTFKRWLTRLIPRPTERSTYLLASNLALLLMFWQWRPLGPVLWEVSQPLGQAAIYAAFAGGWLLVLGSACLITPFDLFGLRQVWLAFRVPIHRLCLGTLPSARQPPAAEMRSGDSITWKVTALDDQGRRIGDLPGDAPVFLVGRELEASD